MQTTERKVQTAFRLSESLVMRLKLRAKREERSVNSLVEEALEKYYPSELVWPKIVGPVEISPEVLALRLPEGFNFSEEEIAADDRLAHALGVI